MNKRKICGGYLSSLVLAASLFCAFFSGLQPASAWTRGEASQFYDFVLYGPDGQTEVGRCRGSVAGLTYGTVNITTRIEEVWRPSGDNSVMYIDQDAITLCANGIAFKDSELKSADGSWNYSVKMYNISGDLIGTSEPFYFSGSMTYSAGFRINCTSDLSCSGEATSSEGYTEANIDATALTHSTLVDKYSCSEATGKLGWLMCPVMEGIAGTLSTIWNDYISPLLEVDPAIVGEASATYEAWHGFRRVANILFVIILLFVIFSQLTGFGIDNYGIKKSLPRIIIAAVLVNLSFIICQLAIDLSNIIGGSIYDFLSGLGGKLSIPSAFASGSSAGSATTTTATMALAAGVIYGGVFVITNGILGTIIILLIALVSAVVALLGLFLLLSVRQSLLIMIVILSPLAIICYMLPNTKNLFDRWLKIFEGLIFVFPICGLVVGGGMLASKIILNNASSATGLNAFFMVVTAVVAEVAPFFFIPTLIRGAFKATGQLGAKLTGFTATAPKVTRARLDNATKNGALMKTYQQGRALGKANKIIERHGKRYGSSIPTGGLARLGYNISAARANQAQAVSAGAIRTLSDVYKNSDKNAVNNELNDALRKLDPQRFAAAFRELLNKGGEEEALAALYQNSAAMNDPRMRATIEREVGGTQNVAMKEYAKWKATPAGANGTFQSFVDGGHLTAALNNKGETALVNQNKDLYKFMSSHSAAFATLNEKVISRMITGFQTEDQSNAAAGFLKSLSAQKQADVAKNVSWAGFAGMLDSARQNSSSNVVGGVAINYGAHIAELTSGNGQGNDGRYANIIAGMNQDEAKKYGIIV